MAAYQEITISNHQENVRSSGSNYVFDTIRFLLAFVVFLNIPFWIAKQFTDTYPRGWFNIEFIAIGVLAMFTRRWITWLVLGLDFLGDIAHTSATFYYFSQQDLVHSARFVVALPTGRVLRDGFSLFFFAALWTWIALKIAPRAYQGRKGRLALAFLAIPVLLVGIDVLDGSNGLLRIRDTRAEVKLTSGSTISIARAVLIITQGHPDVDFSDVSSASQEFEFMPKLDPSSFHQKNVSATSTPQPNLVLIVFESFGLFRDQQKQKLLTSVFESPELNDRYRIEIGKVPFKGASVAGEFRELCGVWAGVMQHPSTDMLSKRCLPNLLRKQGFETTGLHGFNSYLFGRDELYPKIGFEHSIFREHMLPTGKVHDCRGAFVGVCDADIAKLITAKLLEPTTKPQFIYWMTLDSHLPTRADAGPKTCGEGGTYIDNADICGWLTLVHRTLSNIAAIAATPGLPPTEFIIVGDHAPPFIFQSARGKFENTFVPSVHLIPRIAEPSVPEKQISKAKLVETAEKPVKNNVLRPVGSAPNDGDSGRN